MHHMKPDCPTLKKDTPKVMKTDSKKEVVVEATPAPTSTGEPMGGAWLLKSLEIAGAIPVQKAVHAKAADPKSSLRALLDGGAMHVLRPAHSTEEYTRERFPSRSSWRRGRLRFVKFRVRELC